MLTEFEMQEAKSLKESIDNSFHQFIFNPNLAKDIDRLEFLQKRCNHIYQGGKCVYCGKEINDER